MYTVLVSAPYFIPELGRFREIFDRHNIKTLVPAGVVERLEEDQLLSYAGLFDGAICGDDRFTRRVLKACRPRLKVIAKWGTGIDSIDGDAAKEMGIEVYRTPDAFTDPVADTVIGYILAFARRLPWSDRQMKSGLWNKLPARSLKECVLGVIGVGHIGKAVMRRAHAFGMKLLGNDIVEIDSDFVRIHSVEMTTLENLLARSDFVSLNCDLNPTSYHLINAETLAMMKPGSLIINTARGQVIDELAMIRSLETGQLAGAALDVFEAEPLPVDSPLRQMDNVLLAPHNANSSPAAWERVHRNTLRNLFKGLGIPDHELD
jgi:D-3-phosphoglycerate dehydrogenase